MEVTAELRPDPTPPKRDVVTKVCAAPPAPATVESERAAGKLAVPVQLANHTHANSPSEARDTMSQPRNSRDLAVPLTADLRRLHMNVSRRFLGKAFGDEWMDRFTRRRRRGGEAPPPSDTPSASSS
jgi:hypothetical protein